MTINCVNVSGNLVADCEKKTAGQTPLLTFVIAVNERRKNGDEWEDYPNFIECNLFGALTKHVYEKLVKGARVCVFGKLHQSRWEKDGQNMSKITITVSDIEIMRKPDKKEETPTRNEIPW